LFVGLSLLIAAPAFPSARNAWSRRGLLIAGALCLVGLVGLVGPAVNNLAWRGLGILGYAVVLPLTCLAIRRALLQPDMTEPAAES